MSIVVKKDVFVARKRVKKKLKKRKSAASWIPKSTYRNKSKINAFQINAGDVQKIESAIEKFEKKMDKEYTFDPDVLGMHFK